MSKESYYFPHDFEPTSDPKMQALIGEFGAIGYGIFWRLIEMLHSDCNHKLPLKEYIFIAIAKQMLTSAEQTKAIINYCINVCELFISDDEFFWSNRVNSNFEKRAEISEKRSIAGKSGAIAKQKLANTSKGKESKVKEIKEDKNNKNINITYSKFYDFEIAESKNDVNYINFVKVIFGSNSLSKKLDRVLSMQEQVTFEQFKSIYNYKQKHNISIGDYLVKMENYKDLTKKNTVVQATLLNWIRRDLK